MMTLILAAIAAATPPSVDVDVEYRLATARSVAAGEPLIVAVGGVRVEHDPGYAIWQVPTYQGDATPRAIVTMPIAGAARVVGTVPGRMVERPAIFPLLRRWSDNRRWHYDPPRQIVAPAQQQRQPATTSVGVVVAPLASGVPMAAPQTSPSCACGPNCPCRSSRGIGQPIWGAVPQPSQPPTTTPVYPAVGARVHISYRDAVAASKAARRPLLVCVGHDCAGLADRLDSVAEVCCVPSWASDGLGRQPRYRLCVTDAAGKMWCIGGWPTEPTVAEIRDIAQRGRAELTRPAASAPIAVAAGAECRD